MNELAERIHTMRPTETEIRVQDDFDLDKIERSGQCFRWQRTGDGAYRIPHGDECLFIRRLSGGRFRLSCNEETCEKVWRTYFDLDADYGELRARVDPRADPFLHAACAYGRGIRILRQDPWETLVSFIISQNKNIPAIKNAVDLLCRAAGERRTDCRGGEYFVFPSPEAILALSDEELKACKLGYRRAYVRAAARAVREGTLPLASLVRADGEATLSSLMSVFGVGIKVANCVSLFGLHHTDAFPVDVWMKRILENEYPDGYPFSRYSPFNGIYQQYMFFYYRDRGNE